MIALLLFTKLCLFQLCLSHSSTVIKIPPHSLTISLRDESQDSTRIVPAVTVKWAHSIPTLLITYEDGIMKLVKVASETNSSQISVDNISFSVIIMDGNITEIL